MGLVAVTSATATASEKPVIVALQKILDDENQERGKLDTRLTDALRDLQSISATRNTGEVLDNSLLRAESKVTESKEALYENHLRIEFLNSFISLLEPAADARAETSKILAEMAHKDLLASVEGGGDSKVWLFCIYLSIAVRDVMEPSENYADFVKKFMNYSTLRDPHPPGEFMKGKDRKYLSGPEKLGDKLGDKTGTKPGEKSGNEKVLHLVPSPE